MSRWRSRLLCRLFGHSTRTYGTMGGWPHSPLFQIDADCRRCGTDLSITIPSAFTIYPREEQT